MSKRRWVYTEGGKPLPEPVEVTQEWKDPGVGPSHVSEAEVYGNLAPATDGTDISSRTRHAEYMRRNNLTIADDYKETWQRAEKERTTPGRNVPEIREAVGRALYESEKKRRR